MGIDVSRTDRAELEAGLDRLAKAIGKLGKSSSALATRLLPDVEIFHRAVHDALAYREFFSPGDVAAAKALLKSGLARADQLADGKTPWTTQTGLVVRGFRSRLDGTAQPYGLVIPASYAPTGSDRFRCDLWFHGRGETLSEVKFLDQRSKQVGQYAPRNAFVLHPYGRYSNAFKFAGEVDVLEALAHAQRNYRLDDDRIAARGFSMGGAACWQFAVHYADRFFAANPGAGFSETPEFLRTFQQETLNPTWYERTLWRMYDCPGYAINLAQCPTIAYSGEVDRQKQAADVMETALARVGIDMVHVIGPKTGHRIHPDSKKIIAAKLDSLAIRGRNRVPRTVRFATYTLKYDRMHWVRVTALDRHWEQARVDAKLIDDSAVIVTAKNVSAMELFFPAGWAPFDVTRPVTVTIDGKKLAGPRPLSDRSWRCPLYRDVAGWKVGKLPEDGLRKRHDLQGPIDDAFMDSFLFVRPTGRFAHPAVETWVESELARAIVHWRRHFRGVARVKDDVDVDTADIAAHNLVLWGDPPSNAVLAKIAAKLPVGWNGKRITVGKRTFDAAHHAPVLIFPNPLNPDRYVVLNSGFTYREYAYLNNARQVPMLPDWAVVDLRTPPGTQYPGRIAAAGFFGERWELLPLKDTSGR